MEGSPELLATTSPPSFRRRHLYNLQLGGLPTPQLELAQTRMRILSHPLGQPRAGQMELAPLPQLKPERHRQLPHQRTQRLHT